MNPVILLIIVSVGVFAGNLATDYLERFVVAIAFTRAWKRQLHGLAAAQEEATEEVK